MRRFAWISRPVMIDHVGQLFRGIIDPADQRYAIENGW